MAFATYLSQSTVPLSILKSIPPRLVTPMKQQMTGMNRISNNLLVDHELISGVQVSAGAYEPVRRLTSAEILSVAS